MSATKTANKFTRSKTILFSRGPVDVIFVPAKAPPFTHRVIVQNNNAVVGKSWYDPSTGQKINAKTAAYYAEKFGL